MATNRNADYWEKRRADELYGLLAGAEDSVEQLRQLYLKATRETQDEIKKLVRRFQLEHELTEQDAIRILRKVKSPKDIRALYAALEKDPKSAELAAEIEGPAYAARIKRLEATQRRIDQTVRDIYEATSSTTDDVLEHVAEESYYREIFTLQQQADVAFPFEPLKKETVEKILNSRWSGRSYSENIWDNTQALADAVKREMLLSVLTGKSNKKIERDIFAKFGGDYNNVRRLVRTEACYVANQMKLETYKETGVKWYMYSAILDMRTSEKCRNLDGRKYKVSKARVGENYPPMHPWCRSTTIAAMPDSLLERMKRKARDMFGKVVSVPLTETYRDWFDKWGPDGSMR